MKTRMEFLCANFENVIQVLSLLSCFRQILEFKFDITGKTYRNYTFQLIYYSIFAMCNVFPPITSFRRT